MKGVRNRASPRYLNYMAEKHKPPQVPKKGGDTWKRDRDKDEQWRYKRSDAKSKTWAGLVGPGGQ
jgi:hypothetical protein